MMININRGYYASCPNNLASNYMSNLIQSLPPLPYSRELLTHGWGNHGWLMERRWRWRWRRSPLRQGAGTTILDPKFRFRGGGGAPYHFWKKWSWCRSFRLGGAYIRKEGERRRSRARATPGRGPRPTCGWGPPLLLGWPLREPS